MAIRLESPAFWTRPPGVTAWALSPFASLYGSIAARRMQQIGRKAPLPVICIGNYVAGGQGKTPTALGLARLAQENGLKPLFVTRGFGGRLEGPVLVNPHTMSSEDVGDEALLLSAAAPTVVARRRADLLDTDLLRGFDLILMDDGFQSPSLHKDRSIIVADGAIGMGNGCVIPAGPLRAPLDLQLAKTDLLLVIRDAGHGVSGAEGLIEKATAAGVPIAYGRLAPGDVSALKAQPLLAFAGIGRPEKFYATLRAAGLTVSATRDFPDHHRFSEADAQGLRTAAARDGLQLITTEKDAARMAGATGTIAELRARTHALPVRLLLDDIAPVLVLLEH